MLRTSAQLAMRGLASVGARALGSAAVTAVPAAAVAQRAALPAATFVAQCLVSAAAATNRAAYSSFPRHHAGRPQLMSFSNFIDEAAALLEAERAKADSPEEDSASASTADNGQHFDEFATSGLDERIVKRLGELGFHRMFGIQQQTIEHCLAGRDVLGKAVTGSGKSLAFILPILHRLAQAPHQGNRTPRAIILSPTRELAQQLHRQLADIESAVGMRSACIYGGSSYEAQARQIQSGVDILVATPGRLIDLINNRHCDLSEVSVVALDEADEMMSPSFSDDIQFMLSQAQRDRQMLLFSATMPPSVSSLVNRCMSPNYHTIDTASTAVPSKIAHFTFPIRGHASRSLTASLLVSSLRPRRTIVFSNKKTDCTEIAERMQSTGIAAAPVHSDLSQSVRTDLMNRFRKGTLKVLVATDVAARGIDIPECDLVIHTEPPTSLESYVHRSGRTGRAGRTGVVAMFDDGQSNQLLRDISNRAELSFVDAPTENDFALYSVSDAIDRILEVDDAIAAHYLPSVDLLISRHGDARSVLAKAVACNAEGSRKMIQDMYREPVRHQFSRGGDRDRGFGGRGDRDRGGRGDRGFGGDRDRGFGGRGDRDRGGRGDRDRGGRGFGGRGSGYGNDFGY